MKAASGLYGLFNECRCETVISCSGSFGLYRNVSVGGKLFAVGLQICMSRTCVHMWTYDGMHFCINTHKYLVYFLFFITSILIVIILIKLSLPTYM